jgi:hypothetical protein
VGPRPLARAADLQPAASTSTTARAGRVATRGSSAPDWNRSTCSSRSARNCSPSSRAMRSSWRPLMVTSAKSATASAASRNEGSRAAQRTSLRSTEGL